ncbi:hypothetical protein Ancab_012415 [Ancistrocladus abbreviatus]
MHSEDDVPRFLKLVNEDGRLNYRARPFGCRLVLLSPSSSLTVGEAIKAGESWVMEEVDCVSSSSGRTTNKDKLHLSGDSGNTIVRPWNNVFIPDTISRLQKGYPCSDLQAMEGKAESEKPRTSAFSLCPALPVSSTPNTKATHTSHGKAGALRKC